MRVTATAMVSALRCASLLGVAIVGGCYLSHVAGDGVLRSDGGFDAAVPRDAERDTAVARDAGPDSAVLRDAGIDAPVARDAGASVDARFDASPCSPVEPVLVLDMLAEGFGSAGCVNIDVPASAPATTCEVGSVRLLRIVTNVGNDLEFRTTVTAVTSPATVYGQYFLDTAMCTCTRGGSTSDEATVGSVSRFAVTFPASPWTVELGLIGDGVSFHFEVCALHI